MEFLKAGDSALIIEVGNEISPEINFKLKKITEYLDALENDFITDLLPTYKSMIVYYNPLKISFDSLKKIIEEGFDTEKAEGNALRKEIVEIPVLYGGEYGLDIENIASHNKISVEEVIKIHTSEEYLIYMLGFTPGFPYLGGMSKKIATPRLETPRVKIPAGSVGIAGEQTGVYPIESPGGWQLLGRSPLEFFSPLKERPFLLKAGDYIKFKSISQEEYDEIKKEIISGNYVEKRYLKEM
ncbi:MAG: 5-oxoprolinase subunit PxpB [Fusobacteriaceae bacterium]